MYNISSYVSSTPPQLLRCDLWGSFTPDFCCHCYPTNTGIEKYIIMLFISHLSKSVSKPLSCSMLSHFTEICCLVVSACSTSSFSSVQTMLAYLCFQDICTQYARKTAFTTRKIFGFSFWCSAPIFGGLLLS